MKPLLLYLAAHARACGWAAFATLCASCAWMLSDADYRAAVMSAATWMGILLVSTVCTAGWLLAQLLERDEPEPPLPPRAESLGAARRRAQRERERPFEIPRPTSPDGTNPDLNAPGGGGSCR